MTMDARPVLYAIACGAPPARDLPALVEHARHLGWDVCAVLTPTATRFVDTTTLADVTGHPVRTEYKHPDESDVLPPAQAFVFAPATFNTINKIAHGISDTLAVGLACEALGAGLPVVIAPWQNHALTNFPAYGRSLTLLTEAGADLVLTDRTVPGGPDDDGSGQDDQTSFPWPQVHRRLADILRRPSDHR